MEIEQLDELQATLDELEKKSKLRWQAAMAPRRKEEKKGLWAATARFVGRYQVVLAVLASIVMGGVPIFGLFADKSAPKKTAYSSQGTDNAGSDATTVTAATLSSSAEPYSNRSGDQSDPIREVIRKIQTGDFQNPEEVAVGVFLLNFSRMAHKLVDLDPSGLSPLRRGPWWSDLEGLFKIPEAPWEKKVRPKGTFQLRFVRSIEKWKLENLRIFADEDAP